MNSMVAEILFVKIETYTLRKLEIEGNTLNLIMDICANFIVNSERKTF